MRAFFLTISLIFCGFGVSRAQWQQQTSGTDVQLRGLSVVSDKVVWASGARGTVLRTVDGGATWAKIGVPDSDELDFRDVQAFDQDTAFLLSIGESDKSRIYKTADGGKSWQLQFTNRDPRAFYDCFAFWDRKHGIALSDAVDEKFPLLATSDGATWAPLVPKNMPAAMAGEGAFAASGTCIATFGENDVWFGTGIPAARVFHSPDRGANWTVAETPILHGTASQGIFSLFFWSEKDGIAVGGDYDSPAGADKTAAITRDGGKSWEAASAFPHGYRSGVASARLAEPAARGGALIAVGTGGADYSLDAGKSWAPQLEGKPWSAAGATAYNSVGCFQAVCWAVGPNGRIAKLQRPAK